jgi:hypothetical protein
MQDCPPPLVSCETTTLPSFDPERPDVVFVVSECVSSTHEVIASYDLLNTPDLRTFRGTVEIRNKASVRNTIRFRHAFSIAPDRRPWIPEDSVLCYDLDANRLVLQLEIELPAGSTIESELEYDVPFGDMADFNRDGKVNGADSGILQTAWGSANATCDLDRDGVVGSSDLGILIARWTG